MPLQWRFSVSDRRTVVSDNHFFDLRGPLFPIIPMLPFPPRTAVFFALSRVPTKYFQEFVYYILFSLIILAIIFGVAGIGIKILNEIYKKAIEYKEENDFTI